MAPAKPDIDQLRNKEEAALNTFKLPADFDKVIKSAALRFRGTGTTLESAMGAYFMGQFYGWRVLRMMHGSKTYNHYEDLLGVKFTDCCPDRGPLARRSRGLGIADALKSFWKVATGKAGEAKRGEIDPDIQLPHRSA